MILFVFICRYIRNLFAKFRKQNKSERRSHTRYFSKVRIWTNETDCFHETGEHLPLTGDLLTTFAHPPLQPLSSLRDLRRRCAPLHIPHRLRRVVQIQQEKALSSKLVALFLAVFAVRGGFEPPVRLPVRQFSKLVVSATHPSHQNCPVFLNGTAKI